MSVKEERRIGIMEKVKHKAMTLVVAASLMSIDYRQAKRIWARYQKKGAHGLIHQSRGRISSRRTAPAIKKAVIEAYIKRYSDFSIALALEEIASEGHHVSYTTLRRWLKVEGVYKRHHRYSVHRTRRERKAYFGMMLQLDGSHHDWFEGRRGTACLMNLVDDATGVTMARLEEEETTLGAMRLLSAWIQRYGIPETLYCDRKNTYVLDREPTVDEQMRGELPLTAFGKACKKLGIRIIIARSPQAKGRVERNHAVYQDRFVKKMRLKNISDIETANRYLAEEFCDGLNNRFAVVPKSTEDHHVPMPKETDRGRIFCIDTERTVHNDYVVRLENRLFQLLDQKHLPRPKKRVIVSERYDGTVHVFYNDHDLQYKELEGTAFLRASKKSVA